MIRSTIALMFCFILTAPTYSQRYYPPEARQTGDVWSLFIGDQEKCQFDADSIGTTKFSYFEVMKDGKWGITDSECNTLIEPAYDAIDIHMYWNFLFTQGDQKGLIDTSGLVLTQGTFQDIDSYEAETGLSLVKIDGEWQYVNNSQERIEMEQLVFRKPTEIAYFSKCEDDSASLDEHRECSNLSLLRFVYGHLKYPPTARNDRIQGRVTVQFDISNTGEVLNPRVIKDIGGGCGEAALDVVALMESWIPAQKDGQRIYSQFTLPVVFKLE